MMMLPKPLWIASLGTMIEWAEYTLYAYLAPVLAGVFFSEQSTMAGMIGVYGIFAAGFITRPLGGWWLGHVGDTKGRRVALQISMLLMGLGTLLIGLLPAYTNAGALGALGLLFARILQGLGMGGEFIGAAIYAIERYPKKPASATSFICAAAALGMVIGGSLAHQVSLYPEVTWAWRVPFLLGAVGCWIAYRLRRYLQESLPTRTKGTTPSPLKALKDTFIACKTSALTVAALSGFTGVLVYTFNSYLLFYLQHYAQMTASLSTKLVTFSQFGVVIVIPIFGYIADRIMPYRMYLSGLIATVILSPVIFWLCADGSPRLVSLGLAFYVLINGMTSSSVMVLAYRSFKPEAAYLSIATLWGLAAAFFSGTTPLVASLLVEHISVWGPSLYVQFFAISAALFSFFSRRKLIQQ